MQTPRHRRFAAAALLALAAWLPARAQSPTAPLAWTDLDGRSHRAAELSARPATVFFFSSPHCPVAQRLAPTVTSLARTLAARGIVSVLVHSGEGASASEWKAWARATGFPGALVRDPDAALARRLGATLTPEAVLVDRGGVARYIGRIDALEPAVDAVLAGKPAPRPRVRALGCQIFAPRPAAAPRPRRAVTFSRDVAPILNRNCVSCHRAGDVAPFALTRYAEARPWARAIQSYTSRRLMPPWKAVPGHGDFLDSRWLSDRDLETLAAWADSGAPEGDPKDLPPPPALPPAGGWQLGTPDRVLQPVGEYHLAAEGRDVYRNFTLPIDFERDTDVAAFEFKPGNRAIVHHIIAYIDRTGKTAARLDGRESEPGWSVSGGASGIVDEEWGDSWAPGMNPRRLEPGVAVRIPRGAKLVLQVHYHKSGKPEVDRSTVALHLARGPVRKILHTASVGNVLFAIPPGVDRYPVAARGRLPFDLELWAILPHMHQLGKTMRVDATLPDGTRKSLVSLVNWDFNWQMAYRYRQPLRLPKGTLLELSATYDNTTANPNQPSNPPRRVTYGEQTDDEMCFAFLAFTAAQERPGLGALFFTEGGNL